jgi:hypothetical protein
VTISSESKVNFKLFTFIPLSLQGTGKRLGLAMTLSTNPNHQPRIKYGATTKLFLYHLFGTLVIGYWLFGIATPR